MINIVIASTKYKHKKEHKTTWMFPDLTQGNRIEHILVNKRREATIITN